MEEIWREAVGTFLGNILLISVVYGFWKAEKIHREGKTELGWLGIIAVLIPALLIGSTLYLQG